MTSRSEPTRARVVATQVAKLLASYLDGRLAILELGKRLKRLGEQIVKHEEQLQLAGADADRRRKPEDEREKALVDAVFGHWQTRLGKHSARLTPGRREKILARLRDGYSMREMQRAIDACARSDFHMGKNDRDTEYNDLTFILRNGEKLERFLEMAGHDPEAGEAATVRRLRQQAQDALERGDTAAYNDANNRIRRLQAQG